MSSALGIGSDVVTTGSPAVLVRGLRAGYPVRGGPDRPALVDLDLSVAQGEVLAVLGPSGCGKTTLLRVLAGLLPATAGRVELAGRVVVDGPRMVAPEQRGVGLVPQEASLFPNRDVAANIEFGLRARRMAPRLSRDRAARRRRVSDMLDLIGMSAMATRYPHELSGGQRQRVALARALAPAPGLVLLDEAFGALDAALRGHLRADVAQILRRSGSTAILVTHDQDEALSMADRLVLLRQGRRIQVGTPERVYSRPADAWAARFLGDCSFLAGAVRGGTLRYALGGMATDAPDGEVVVVVRPEQVVLDDGPGAVAAVVVARQYRGHSSLYRLRLAGSGELLLAAQPGGPHRLDGETVLVRVAARPHALPAVETADPTPP